MAGRGALGVDGAADRFADCSIEGDAVGGFNVGPLHGDVVVIDRCGQLGGNCAAEKRLRLRPIERDPEIGATGAARKTWITHDP